MRIMPLVFLVFVVVKAKTERIEGGCMSQLFLPVPQYYIIKIREV